MTLFSLDTINAQKENRVNFNIYCGGMGFLKCGKIIVEFSKNTCRNRNIVVK